MAERGVFRNQENARQLVKFEGMRWGKITPTDIDGFLDFGNRLFVFIEAKHGDSKMPYGQALALERLCDACHNPPHRFAVGFVVSHRSSGDIDLANTTITGIRWEGNWRPPKSASGRLIEGIEAFRSRYLQNVVALPPVARDPWLVDYEEHECA